MQRAQALPRHSRWIGISWHHVPPAFTPDQPEHGVADDMALIQAQRVRDSPTGVPEFVFNPRLGETYQEALDIQANPRLIWIGRDQKQGHRRDPPLHRRPLVHHRSRFRNHLKKIKPEAAAKLVPLDNMLVRITQQDVVYRRYLNPGHRAFIPDFRCLHPIGRCRQDHLLRTQSPVSHVLRRAPQSLAHVAIQSGHRPTKSTPPSATSSPK